MVWLRMWLKLWLRIRFDVHSSFGKSLWLLLLGASYILADSWLPKCLLGGSWVPSVPPGGAFVLRGGPHQDVFMASHISFIQWNIFSATVLMDSIGHTSCHKGQGK